jgi:hypothetical protein
LLQKYCQLNARKENLVWLVERMHAYQEDQLGQLSERKQELFNNEEGGAVDEEQLLAIE